MLPNLAPCRSQVATLQAKLDPIAYEGGGHHGTDAAAITDFTDPGAILKRNEQARLASSPAMTCAAQMRTLTESLVSCMGASAFSGLLPPIARNSNDQLCVLLHPIGR